MSKQVNRVNIESELCMETGLPLGSIMKYNFLIYPFSSDMHISPTIHYK